MSKAKKKKTKKVKKQTKRNYAKNGEAYPALNAKRQVFNRRDYMDCDYFDQLNEEEKEWMNSFLSETIVTNFNHLGPDLYVDEEDKRQFYRDNNRRNRCMYNIAKSKGSLYSLEGARQVSTNDDVGVGVEDLYIETITLKRRYGENGYDTLLDELHNAEDNPKNDRGSGKKSGK